ncbi:MAG: peptidylprolyl isomerase [Treponema sp.]|nr:peptidylprolyl isomerase [Treponema sp.]
MKIESNKVVQIHYTLTDTEGKEIDSSVGRDPLQYVHGNGYLITGLERELEGKEPGDKLSVDVEPKDAYGEYDEKLIVEVPRTQFDTSVDIQVGMQFQGSSPAGPAIVTVTKVEDDKITIDANHELAGKKLHFDVEIVNVRDLTEEELAQMNSHGCGGCGGGCSSCGGCGSDGGCGSGCGGCN